MREAVFHAHLPVRPMWLCRVDAHPWPCGAAKLALRERFGDDGSALKEHLEALRVLAHDDLTELDGGREPDLTARFLTWVRERNP